MFKLSLENKTSRENFLLELSDNLIDVKDNCEYIITVDTDESLTEIKPMVLIGDIEISLYFISENSNGIRKYQSRNGSFFDNAIFLNYFGQCELLAVHGEFRKSYLLNVNVNGYKATIAKEMLEFLSKNSDDILQTCFSKSRSGFSRKIGDARNIVKLRVLDNAISTIEKSLFNFTTDKKKNIEHKLLHNSNKHKSVDDKSISWLSENMDDYELSNSKAYDLKIKNKHYKTNIPNSVPYIDTDLNENKVLHKFTLTALSYLKETRASIEKQNTDNAKSVEYEEYIKFDQVIKDIISPIFIGQVRSIDSLIERVTRIHVFFKKHIPVKSINNAMPVQTQFSLRHRHYAIAFNEISKFYKSTDADKKSSEFLLGLRNLSQLFEYCCLYSMVSYFRSFSTQKSASWTEPGYSWSGQETNKYNILANDFSFENDHFKYDLLYEKEFRSLNIRSPKLQENNLIRVDKKNNFYVPDFVIKVTNISSGEYYFIILDAKFSRRSRMRTTKDTRAPSALQSVYNKYATNLRTFQDGGIVNLTRYVGVLFGLSKDESEQKRILLFNEEHDINGSAPLFPFSAADYISFSSEGSKIDSILEKYIQH